MSIVKRKSQKTAKKESLDDGISVYEALNLIRKSEYFDEIYEIFQIKEFENDFINIKGANLIVEQLIKSDEECLKLDIDCELSDVNIEKFTEENQIIFEFANIKDENVLKKTKSPSFNSSLANGSTMLKISRELRKMVVLKTF